MFTRLKRRLSGEDPQAPPGVDPVSSRGASLEAELNRLGCLPTAADPVLYRGLAKTGFGLFLYLETGLDLQTLHRLADSHDRGALLRRIAAEKWP